MDKYIPLLVEFCAAIEAEPHLLQCAELKFLRDCMHEHLSPFATSSDEEEEEAPPDDAPPVVLDLSERRGESRAPVPCVEDLVANPAVMDMARCMMNNPQLMQQMLSGMTSNRR